MKRNGRQRNRRGKGRKITPARELEEDKQGRGENLNDQVEK